MERADVAEEREELTPTQALRIAWFWWITLLFLPFFVFLYVIVDVMIGSGVENPAAAEAWFIASLVWTGLGVPTAFLLRSVVFKAYWTGGVVEPRQYLRGMILVWATIELAGIISLVGCAVTHTVMPNILPAMVAFMLFAPLWPSGRAMIDPVGASEDAHVFRHPR